MKKKPTNSWTGILKWMPGILISVLIIYLLLRIVNLNDLKNALMSFRIDALFYLILLAVLSIAARGMAWRVMIGEKAKFQDSFFAVSIGYMLNNIIPRSGEIGKAVIMGASTKYGTLHVLSTVVVERALDLAIAAGMFLSTLPLALQMEWLKPIAIISLLLVLIGLIVLFIMANNRKIVHQWITKKGEKIPLIQRYVLPGLDSLLNGFSILTKPGQFLLSLFWIGLCWTFWAFLYFLAIRTFIPQAPFWWAIFTQAVLAMGIALPSAPGGLGVFEGAIVGALSVLGVKDQSISLGMALVLHAIQIVISFILGGIGLLRQGWTFKKLLAQVSNKQS
jgi:glycosyltransferase 2 family protein